MAGQFIRTEYLLGEEAVSKLQKSHVAVFGIGGVGGYLVEALARSGVGEFDIIDNDNIELSNINRQIIATHKTLGMAKVDVMKERILEINPNAKVNAYKVFYSQETADQFDFTKYDYIADAIDSITSKINIAFRADKNNIRIISAMGAGNKLDPTKFEVADIYDTSVCPLAKVMRKELRSLGVSKLKVVYSKEIPSTLYKKDETDNEKTKGKRIIGSVAFVPSVAGLIMAGEIIKDLSF